MAKPLDQVEAVLGAAGAPLTVAEITKHLLDPGFRLSNAALGGGTSSNPTSG